MITTVISKYCQNWHDELMRKAYYLNIPFLIEKTPKKGTMKV